LDEASPEGLCPACLLKLGLSGAIPPFVEEPVKVAAPRKRKPLLKWAALGFGLITVAVLAVAMLVRTPIRTPEGPVVRFTIVAPDSGAGDLAISPDGTRLVYTASGEGGQRLLWIRRMDAVESTSMQGTAGAAAPFWSPDSRYVAFFAQGKLKSVPVTGGGPTSLCDAPNGRGGSWDHEGGILFASMGGLKRVPSTGGTASVIATPDPSHAEVALRNPSFLPDGLHFLVSSIGAQRDKSAVYVGALDRQDRTLLIRGAEAAVYSDGFVLFLRDRTLLAQPFDPAKLELLGEPRPIADGVRAAFSASSNGVLAYRNGDDPKMQLAWFDRQGKMLGPVGEPAELGGFAPSPDGSTVAVARRNSEEGGSSLWLLDLARGTNMRLTFAPLRADSPGWSPDGRRIAFEGENGLYQVASNSAAPPELLLKLPGRGSVDSWSSDGKFLFYTEAGPKTSSLRALPLSDDRKPTPVVESAFNVRRGRISPDSRWIAYVSDETGRDEIYVQTFPAGGGKWLVSGNGGTHPEWRGDGRELFFASPERMIMSVTIAGGANAMEAGIAHPLFRIPGPATFAVTRDGLRFLVKIPATDPESEAIHVVLNWRAELQRH